MGRSVLTQRLYRSALAAILACTLLAPANADGTRKRESENGKDAVNIKNFGQVNDHIYRGGQPEGEDFRKLTSIGIKTIVDLRADNESGAKAAAEAAGLRYINLPMKPKGYPEADAAKKFLDVVNDPANGAVYVHCAGGRHRTGVMVAVYRMSVDGWDIDRAYQEMKDYDFYTSWGHGCYKDYVFDYYKQSQTAKKIQPATNAGN